MRRLINHLIVVTFAACVGSAIAHAGVSWEATRSDQQLLEDWRFDVYVVKVKSVDDKDATNARPPKLVLMIKEALRGELKPGAEIEAIWCPVQHDIDTTGREKELEAWKSSPLAGPKVGAEFIVLENVQQEQKLPFRIGPRCRYPLTKEKRDWVASLMGDWRPWRAAEAAKKEAEAREKAKKPPKT